MTHRRCRGQKTGGTPALPRSSHGLLVDPRGDDPGAAGICSRIHFGQRCQRRQREYVLVNNDVYPVDGENGNERGTDNYKCSHTYSYTVEFIFKERGIVSDHVLLNGDVTAINFIFFFVIEGLLVI